MLNITLQLMFSINGNYNNQKILCCSKVIKPLTESYAEKNCCNCETGAVSNQAVFVKYYLDFKVFSPNHERNVKIHFLGNFLHSWRFQ